jgi:methyl-accepting chemotaxis protein
LVNDIAAASSEQAEGVAQVNRGLSQIETVTQENTANSEELAAAAEELSAQSQQVMDMVDRFKLKEEVSGNYGNTFSKPQQHVKQRWIGSAPEKETLVNETSEGDQRPVNPDELISLNDNEFGKYAKR